MPTFHALDRFSQENEEKNPKGFTFTSSDVLNVVELVSERFNYRARETLDVRPGETTAHTVSLPMGSVRVTAPDGAEIRIDGAAAEGRPAHGRDQLVEGAGLHGVEGFQRDEVVFNAVAEVSGGTAAMRVLV